MKSNIWARIKEELVIWRVGLKPGCTILCIIILARLSGLLQPLEWLALDTLLRSRPLEPLDERITIIGINEADISRANTYPLSDRDIAKLISKVHNYNPRVIGLDIFRNFPVEPGHSELISSFKTINNLIAIEKIVSEAIKPPPSLPAEQVAFADAILDVDGHLRRGLLGTPANNNNYKYSLALRLAETYLASESITLENGIEDRDAMRFSKTELPRFLPNFGGYIRTDAGGVQIILNFRKSKQPFRMISIKDIEEGNFNDSWLRDRIVIIGVTAPSVKDTVNTAAITGINSPPGVVYGVEIQAHLCSQIVNAVLENRPNIKVWSEGWEYAWIAVWAIIGIILSRVTQSPVLNIVSVSVSSLFLVAFSYLVLIAGWWVPVVPTLLVLVINGLGLTTFYRYDRSLRLQIQERQLIIERTFDAIHNGPLQTLAKLLRNAKEVDIPQNQLVSQLEHLNSELRAVYESMKRENLTQGDSLFLGEGREFDLQAPMQEILYGVYSQTLERDFPYFKTLKVKVRTFDPIDSQHLTVEQKRGLCRFLEEALCNVGKYAIGATRLSVTCTPKDGWYILSIIDNGQADSFQPEGRGTQQSLSLARQLKGKFRREPLPIKGTICELTWPILKFKAGLRKF